MTSEWNSIHCKTNMKCPWNILDNSRQILYYLYYLFILMKRENLFKLYVLFPVKHCYDKVTIKSDILDDNHSDQSSSFFVNEEEAWIFNFLNRHKINALQSANTTHLTQDCLTQLRSFNHHTIKFIKQRIMKRLKGQKEARQSIHANAIYISLKFH